MKDLELVIPVKNEEHNINEIARRIKSSLALTNISYNIIFVLDKSSDNTLGAVNAASEKFPIILHEKLGKGGKGYSLIEGISIATAKYVGYIDGDLQYPPEVIGEMYTKLLNDDVGVVVANRKIYKSNSFLRKTGSRLNKLIFGKMLLGLDCDIQSGLKIFKRDIFDHVDLTLITPWTFDIPLLSTAKELGYKTEQVDITFENRQHGMSKVLFLKAASNIAKCAIKTKFRDKKIYHLKEEKSKTGFSLLYRKKNYVTHTNLIHHKSAIYTLNRVQQIFIGIVLLLILFEFIINPLNSALIFVALLSAIYFFDVFFSLYVVAKSLRLPPEVSITATDIEALKDEDLPLYTVMCPLYKEWEVLPQFVNNISKMDWPKDKLEVLLLLEENDAKTIETAKNTKLPEYVKIVIVPHSMPKTKPKACNYGLYTATGEYIVVYDAEDQPEYDQLKKAYIAFQKSNKDVFCIQGKLNYYNPNHNLLTRLFTAEYSLWFDVMLPGLQSIDTTIPLGGTSNHFRTKDLLQLNGWDPFNVTEDCDLGVRLFKEGYKTALIDSTTLEEANSNLKNWIRQRSRWIKGYMQTYFVHMRDPIQFLKKKGKHALIFQLIIGMRMYFMLINPILWIMTISYFVFYKYVGSTIEYLYPTLVFYMAGIALIFGNFMYLYNYMIGCAKRGHWHLIKYVFLVPFYWVMISVAAFLAFYQLLFNPHHWEKTNHGLHLKLAAQTASAAVAIPYRKRLSLQNILTNLTFLQGAKSAGVLVIVGVFTNFLNYLYNAYLSRKISLEDYGLIGLVGSFLLLSTIPFGALFRTVTNKTAYYFGKYNTPIRSFWASTRKRALYVGFIISCTWLLFTPLLKVFFNSSTLLPFIIFTPIWTISAMAAVDSAYLNGILKFKVLALVFATEAISKFIITIILVESGFAHLVYLAILISILISFTVGYFFARSVSNTSIEIKTSELNKFPMKFFYSSILINISSITFLTLDIVLAKHYLNPKDAGLYALISLIGKMIFFVGGLFGQFILPIISKAEGELNESKKTFNKIFALSSAASIVMYLAVGILGDFTAPLLLGNKIIDGVRYLPYYGFAILLFSISTNLVSYNQIKNRNLFTYFSLVMAVCEIIFIGIFHKDIHQFISVILVISIVNLFITFLLHYFESVFFLVSKNLTDLMSPLFKLPKDFDIQSASKRVLIFNWRDTKHIWAGGAEVYIHEISKKLINEGYVVTVLCGNDRKNSRFEIVDGVQVIRIGGFYTVYILAPLYYILKLRKHVDIVIDSENGIPFFTPLFCTKPIIGLIHHVHHEIILKELKLRFYQFPAALVAKLLESKFMPFIYSNVQMITVSQSSKEDMLKIGFGKDKDILIINPGVDLDLFLSKRKFKNPTLLYLGRLKAYKQIETLLKAMEIVLRDFPKAKLIIAGFGDARHSLEKLTKQIGIEKAVEFKGKVEEKTKIKLLGASWVFGYPSSMEGWGISIIEANACGTPVVASRVPGLSDSVSDLKSGFLVELGNEQQFAEKIKVLFTDTNIRKNMEKYGKQWARQYTWEMSAKKLSAVIKDTLTEEFNPGFNIDRIFAKKEEVGYER